MPDNMKPMDMALFVGQDRKIIIKQLVPGGRIQTHFGIVHYDDLFGKPFGIRMKTHLDQPIFILKPTTHDLIQFAKRKGQIIFPKDLGYILIKLGIAPGMHVAEAGTGSGGMTLGLATAVGESGHVYSYDVREDMQSVAHGNLLRSGLSERVTFKTRDIAEGFDERSIDALFLDVREPWNYLDVAWGALAPGGMLGIIVPTVNQVQESVYALFNGPWFMVEVEEMIWRDYKVVPDRIRPNDRIVGHTGYLIFARKVIWQLGEPPIGEWDERPSPYGD